MLEQNPLVIKVKEIAQQDHSVEHGTEVTMTYRCGYDDGKIELAREILDTLGIAY